MTPFIEPSVGRIVWYWPARNEPLRSLDNFSAHGPQPMAAQIVYVWGDTLVNLSVSDHEGRQHPRINVRLLQCDDRPRNGEAHCEWMPWQRQQAR